jgi:uncharacterized protein (DUF2164 family)
LHKKSALDVSAQSRSQAVLSLRSYSAENWDQELSELQATLLFDHILADLAPAIYNQAIADARLYVEERAADLDASLQKAEFPVSSRRKR